MTQIKLASSRSPFARRVPRLLMAFVVSILASAAMPPLASAQAASPPGQPQVLPTVELTAGIHRIRAMVAQTPEQRSIGLMWRTDMAPNDGMLFVFEQPQTQCFWMKNTLIPLAIAFVADDGTLVNLDEMKAQTTVSHCSTRPVRYVLEMNAGWFKRKGLTPGDRIGGGPFRK